MSAEHETDPALLGRVHFIGMGGAGMSAVAKLMLARGVPVSGSDRQDSPALRQLQDLGATVHVGQRAEHVDGAQTVVVSTAIPPEDPEYSAARAAGSWSGVGCSSRTTTVPSSSWSTWITR